jgi:hypothetical protein
LDSRAAHGREVKGRKTRSSGGWNGLMDCQFIDAVEAKSNVRFGSKADIGGVEHE